MNKPLTGLDTAYNIIELVRPDALNDFKEIMKDVSRYVLEDQPWGFIDDPHDPDAAIGDIIADSFLWKLAPHGHDYWKDVCTDVFQYIELWYGVEAISSDWRTIEIGLDPDV